MRSPRIPLAACATALVLAITGATGPAASAAATGTPLAIAHFSHLVVDQAHGHLFVSGGTGTSGILVTDLQGATVTTIPETTGATGLALSPDGTTLYAALPGGDQITAIDTSTLTQTASYPTGPGTRPDSLAYAGGSLWFGYGVAGSGGIGSLTASGTVTLAADPNPWPTPPTLTSTPGPSAALVAAAQNGAASTVSVYTASAGTLTRTANGPLAIPDLGDIALTPDGHDIVAGSATGVDGRFHTTDLTPDGHYHWPLAGNVLAVAPDGTVAAALNDTTYRTLSADSSGEYNIYATANQDHLAPHGLAWAPDESHLYAVGQDSTGGAPTLQVQSQPDIAPVALRPYQSASAPGEPVSVAIGLNSGMPFPDGTTLHVTRFDATHPGGIAQSDIVYTPSAVNGWSWPTIHDTAPLQGPLSYRVDYPGDATHAPATLSFPVDVAKYAPYFTLTAPTTSARGAQLAITGHLNWPHPGNAHLTTGALTVTRTDLAHPHGTVLGTLPVATDGSFTLHDTPTIGAANTYTFSYDGGSAYLPANTTATVQVARANTTLSVTANAGAYSYGAWAHVTAHLGATYNSRQVTLFAQPYAGTKTVIATGSTDIHGNFSAWYKITRNTVFTAAYAGDYRTNPATATSRTAWDWAQVTTQMLLGMSTTTINSNHYTVYYRDAPAQAPLFRTTLAPVHTGGHLQIVLQRYYSGAWHNTSVQTVSCAALTDCHFYQEYLPWKSLPDYALYRITAQYVHDNTDTTSLDTWGTWQYFTTHPHP
ncbi:YVTN family beta-propeller protein [Streptacidiphilus sp. MAP12-20]|uniref:YncE family protein n=1 Tax=Streptacidiphilus sp. MAP12-20 TaxID=3156299 RepID=UPI003512AEBC